MENNGIANDQITASSEYSDPGHNAWKARLNFVDWRGSWVANSQNPGEYVQVDFGTIKVNNDCI